MDTEYKLEKTTFLASYGFKRLATTFVEPFAMNATKYTREGWST